MGSFRRAACSLITVSILIFVSSVSFASVPAIVGQDDGGTGNSPVSFNMGNSSEMSGGHKVHVNVTTGNLTVKHTDLVIPTKAGNIVIERTYNSIQHLNGVEEGLEVTSPQVGAYNPREENIDINISPGVVWINGERVVVQDYTIDGIPHVYNDPCCPESRYIYVTNLSSGIGSIVSVETSPANASEGMYCVGYFHAVKDEGTLTFALTQKGTSLDTGVEFGAYVTSVFDEGGGDSDDEWHWTLNSGAVRIKGKTYRVNRTPLGTTTNSQYNYYVILSPGIDSDAVLTLQTGVPTETQFPDGYVVTSIDSPNPFFPNRKNNPSRPLDQSVKFKEHKLGTSGKWSFNFESYAAHYDGSSEKIVFKGGNGTVNSMELSGAYYPKSGHTDKRTYYDGKYDSDYSAYMGFGLNPNISGEKYNYFERISLQGVTSKYRGFRVPLPNDQVRDDAVLTERVDANNNKLVYEWLDGPGENRQFAGFDGSDIERAYYIDRIYDDLAGGDGTPDTVEVRFSYADSTKKDSITAITVYDLVGTALPQVVAEYAYDQDTKQLISFTDFHGRSFSYYYGGNNRLIAIEDPGGGLTTFGYECASKKVAQLRSPRFYPGDYEEYTVACPPGVPAEPAVTFLSVPGGDGSGLNNNYSYDWGNRITTELVLPIELVDQAEIEYTWEADVRANTNLLEDRRITNKIIMNESDSAVVSSTTWTYNPTTVMVAAVTDGNDHTTSYQYNSKRQITTIDYPDNTSSSLVYNSANDEIQSRTDRNGNTTTYAYGDPSNDHLVTGINYTVDGTLEGKTFEYDSDDGLLTTATDSEGFSVTYGYDAQGQMNIKSHSRIVDGASTSVTESYERDIFGRLLSSIDAANHETTYTYGTYHYLIEKSEDLEIDGGSAVEKTESYEYDGLGNLIRVTDYNGGVTRYGYDADNLVTSIWKGNGTSQGYTVSTFQYDTTGKVVQKSKITGTSSSPQWHTTEIHRNAAGWVTEVVEVDIPGMTTGFQYDLAGNLVQKELPIVDQQTSIWSYSYDEVNRLVAVEEPGADNSATYTYDPNGNLTGYTDPELNTASFTYNEINRVSEVVQADRSTRYFAYDGEGRAVQSWEETDWSAGPAGSVYTDGGTALTSDWLRIGFRHFPVFDQCVARKIITSSAVSFDRLKVFVRALEWISGNWTVSLQTDSGGKPSGAILKREDGTNAVVNVPAPVTAMQWFEIDMGLGSTISSNHDFWVVFKRTETWVIPYWKLGYEGTSSAYPAAYSSNGTTWTLMTYNIGIELIDTINTQLPANISSYTYNPEGTLAMAALADSQDISYEYNKRGQPTQSVRLAENGTTVETSFFYYPASGWLQTKNTSINSVGGLTMSYKYNALGQVTEIDHPGTDIDPVQYNYTTDGFHRLDNVTDGVTNYVSEINYDLAGRPTAYTFANGFTETITRDSLGRPESLTIFDPAAAANRFAEMYAWNARGNLDSRTWATRDENNSPVDGDTDSMSYDPNDRLWSVESGSHVSYYYSYDGAGNQHWDPLGGPGQAGSFQYDSVNRMTRRNFVNEEYLEFDWIEPDGRKRGNLVSKTLKDSLDQTISTEALYTWSEDNLLLRVDTPNVGYSDYLYDAGGDRIYKLASQGIETFYVFNGLNVAYEFEDSLEEGTTKRYYIHALGRHVASVEIDDLGAEKTYFFHADYLGSVRMISDDNALVVWQKRYAPFGGDEEQSGTIENTYQFTGKGWDEDAGLFYFNARWYDADIGRFISEDPLWGNIFDPQSLNRFAYGRNNPFRFTDPTGMYNDEDNYGDTELFGDPPDDGNDDGFDNGGGDSVSKKSCNIQVRFNSVSPTQFLHGYLLTYPGYKPGVNSWYFRGGPQAASGFPPQLTTNYGPYVPNTPDYNLQSGTQPFMDPIQISESCDSINDTLVDLMEDIDSRGLYYLGVTQNSNAVWAEGYKSFGGNPTAEIHNNYGWSAPGRNDTIPAYNINDYFDYGRVAP